MKIKWKPISTIPDRRPLTVGTYADGTYEKLHTGQQVPGWATHWTEPLDPPEKSMTWEEADKEARLRAVKAVDKIWAYPHSQKKHVNVIVDAHTAFMRDWEKSQEPKAKDTLMGLLWEACALALDPTVEPDAAEESVGWLKDRATKAVRQDREGVEPHPDERLVELVREIVKHMRESGWYSQADEMERKLHEITGGQADE